MNTGIVLHLNKISKKGLFYNLTLQKGFLIEEIFVLNLGNVKN